MTARARRIGPAGTAARVIVALVLLHLALFDEGEIGIGLGQLVAGLFEGEVLEWGLPLREAILGLIAFPALEVGLGLLARRYSPRPLRWDGLGGHIANGVVIVVLLVIPFTAGAVTLFYAVSILVAVWRGAPGCEVTVISNWILGRDDQVGCPLFFPVDAIEGRMRSQRAAAAG